MASFREPVRWMPRGDPMSASTGEGRSTRRMPSAGASKSKRTKPRVVLADHHAIVLEGLRLILEENFEIVAAVRDGNALVNAVQTLAPDVVVAEVSLPLLDGIEATRLIRKSNREVAVIFLTMHSDAVYAKQALEAGASGYVQKSAAAAELVAAIEAALDQRIFLSPSLSVQVRNGRTAESRTPATDGDELTPRQVEVLRSVAQGRSAKEIAGLLHVSPRTVEFHKRRLMQKLSVRSSAELTHFAIRHGILML